MLSALTADLFPIGLTPVWHPCILERVELLLRRTAALRRRSRARRRWMGRVRGLAGLA